MNRGLIIAALGVVVIASACANQGYNRAPPPEPFGPGAYNQGVAYPAPQGQPVSASPVAQQPTRGGSPLAPERHDLPQTRELKPDGPIITTLTPTPAGVAGTFSKDPATGRVTEYVASRPNEQEAQCIRYKPDGTEECVLGVRDGNMCTPHMPIRACRNRAR